MSGPHHRCRRAPSPTSSLPCAASLPPPFPPSPDSRKAAKPRGSGGAPTAPPASLLTSSLSSGPSHLQAPSLVQPLSFPMRQPSHVALEELPWCHLLPSLPHHHHRGPLAGELPPCFGLAPTTAPLRPHHYGCRRLYVLEKDDTNLYRCTSYFEFGSPFA